MHTPSFPHPTPDAHVDRTPAARRLLAKHISRLAVLAAITLAAAGCASQYQFAVEAIKQAGTALPQRSYRLVDARPEARPGDLRFARVAQDVQAALSSRGMFAAPEHTTPELIIEVDFGISPPITKTGRRREPFFMELPASAMGNMQSREVGGTRVAQPQYMGEREVPYVVTTYRKFFRLTARESESAVAGASPRQVWSVLVTNEDSSDDLRGYTRLMVAAAMDHIGKDLPQGQHVVMTRQDGRVAFVAQGPGSS